MTRQVMVSDGQQRSQQNGSDAGPILAPVLCLFVLALPAEGGYDSGSPINCAAVILRERWCGTFTNVNADSEPLPGALRRSLIHG